MTDPQLEAAKAIRSVPVLAGADRVAFWFLTGLNSWAVFWFGESWLAKRSDSGELAFWGTSLIIAYAVASALARWLLLGLMRKPVLADSVLPGRIGVATTFVPGVESLEMLESTVRALVAMRLAHDTWVLDEGDSPDVRALCQRLGARHFTRKGLEQYQQRSGPFAARTKYGNYNAWLDVVGYREYDVIVGFDPDHVPDESFLEASVPFLADPGIGYVQLPQVYYNQSASFIARGAAEETYSYYSASQAASYAMGFPIITGCHNVHRTDALRQVGGFAEHDADDLLITLLYRAAGWRGVYVPEVRAWGLTPTDWPSYLQQQLRWARSVLDVKLRAYPRVASAMPLSTRLVSFVHGAYYVQEGVLGAVSVLLLAYLLAGGPMPVAPSYALTQSFVAMAVALALTDFYRQRYFLQPAAEWGLHLRARFLRFVKWPYIFFGMVDAALGRRHPYSITSKAGAGRRAPLMLWPHFVVCTLLAGCWVVGLARGIGVHPSLEIAAASYFGLTVLALATALFMPLAAPFSRALMEKRIGAALRGEAVAAGVNKFDAPLPVLHNSHLTRD